MGKKQVLALGFFDGIHLGHGALLERTRQIAREKGAEAAILTFDTHPDGVVGKTAVQLLNSKADRAYIAHEYYGINTILLMHFTTEMMHMDWERFVENVVAQQYHACHVVVGHDFRFGYRGQGTAAGLRDKCAALGIGCDVIPEVELDGRVVSSTYIRQLISQGDMEQARRFLGHPHTLSGPVQHGRRIGRTIGLPTINMHLEEGILPPRFGVYATRVHVNNECWLGVTNVGIRPTVDHSEKPEISVETNILDFAAQIYGELVRVDFYTFLRPEQKFPGVEELRAQIEYNQVQTREYFAVLDKS